MYGHTIIANHWYVSIDRPIQWRPTSSRAYSAVPRVGHRQTRPMGAGRQGRLGYLLEFETELFGQMELMNLRLGALPNNKERYDGANSTLSYSGSRFWWRWFLSRPSLPLFWWGPRHDIGDRYHSPSVEGLKQARRETHEQRSNRRLRGAGQGQG